MHILSWVGKIQTVGHTKAITNIGMSELILLFSILIGMNVFVIEKGDINQETR